MPEEFNESSDEIGELKEDKELESNEVSDESSIEDPEVEVEEEDFDIDE